MKRPGLTVLAAGFAALAATAILSPAGAQSLSVDLGGEGGSYTARLIQVFVLITVLSLAPGVLVMATSFVRFVVVFSLLRSALGLQQSPPNVVLVSLALFLTGFVMAPTLNAAWREGVQPMLQEDMREGEGLARAADPFRDFMLSQVDANDLSFFSTLAERQATVANGERLDDAAAALSDPLADEASGEPEEAAQDGPPLQVLLPAFMISELSRAFEIGFLIMMPFLVIDLAIAAILMSMGMMMLPPQTVSLPFKLIFFVLIDGWRVLSESLVQSFF